MSKNIVAIRRLLKKLEVEIGDLRLENLRNKNLKLYHDVKQKKKAKNILARQTSG